MVAFLLYDHSIVISEDICSYIYNNFYFIYTVLIERAIHNSMCSNALIHNYKRYTQLYMYLIIKTI